MIGCGAETFSLCVIRVLTPRSQHPMWRALYIAPEQNVKLTFRTHVWNFVPIPNRVGISARSVKTDLFENFRKKQCSDLTCNGFFGSRQGTDMDCSSR